MVIVRGNDQGKLNSSLDEAVCISYSSNDLGKGIHLTNHFPSMDK